MYFSNIKDEELKHFHHTINASFTMSLTDILASNLFKVDEVVDDSLYRIYPLFYCTNAISSNPNDKILDNKCFICTKSEHETYISFTKTKKDNIILDESLLTLYDIGDSLSPDEFNAMVYRLRNVETLTGKLDFEETSSITGQYATYQLLHAENQPRNDYGYIINNNVKSNPLTVKLLEPFFDKARYTLTFTVQSITGANVLDESDEDYISKAKFSVDLIAGTEVELDLSTYTTDSVLLFESDLVVSFDVAEAVNNNYSLELTSDKSLVESDEEFTLTATLISTGGTTGYNVQFYEEGTLLDTVVTDTNGEASLTVSSSNIGVHTYNCKCIGVTDTVTVSVGSLNLSVNASLPIFTGTQYNRGVFNYSVSGVLRLGDEVLSNKTISLKENNVSIGEVTTGSDGSFSKDLYKEIVPTGSTEVGAEFTNTYELTYTSEYDNTITTTIDVTPSRNTYLKDISLHQLSYGDAYISGVLYSTSQYMLNDKTITIGLYTSDGELIISKTTVYPHTTSHLGRFSLYFDSADLSLSAYVKVVFDGDTFYNRCEFTGVPTIV